MSSSSPANPERLEAARDEVGGNTRGRALDAADADAVEALFDEVGHVDHVASFTGEQPVATVADTTHELYQRALDARVWAARNLCAAGAPRMREGGSFTFCSGVSAWRPRPNRAAGAAATAALESFARGMAVEARPAAGQPVCPARSTRRSSIRAFGVGYRRRRAAVPVDPPTRPARPPRRARPRGCCSSNKRLRNGHGAARRRRILLI